MDRNNCESDRVGLGRVEARGSFFFFFLPPLSGPSGQLTLSTLFTHTEMISQAGSSISCHSQEMKNPLLAASIKIVGCLPWHAHSPVILNIYCQASSQCPRKPVTGCGKGPRSFPCLSSLILADPSRKAA